MENQSENLALFALASAPGFSWARTRRLIEECGTPSAALEAQFGNALFDDRVEAALNGAAELMRDFEAQGVHVTTLWGDDYPRQLRTAHDAPPVLYWQGHMDVRDSDAVAIVGTRNPAPEARDFASRLATLLANDNTPVISGLAKGIDEAAMRASLDAPGRTIGVIGTGHDLSYPTENRALQAEVAGHLLLSQFPPGTQIHKRNFPMRNVVMSGCSAMSVIVQAGEHSGTRIQARVAVKHGRPLILTRAVVNHTTWGRDMVDAGLDISVVGDADEAHEAVRQILDRDRAFAASAGSFLSL
ncbi:MAG: DNA-processing protein DprA [Herbiconiux sp.]|uniref:DNA-processing protein DprA n=1 Tax=Microbacteriaceae TaxID=85023 RepID=UPI001207B9F9|nr:DNA-processing protein DprA [Herbiconiux sp.]TAJ46892.1 MAG: DNA-processing protein DprA [Herbiconiux sp.]